MSLPPSTDLRAAGTHRLIPSRYGDGAGSVLTRIADDDAHLSLVFDLDHATHDRLSAENNRLPGIGVRELVFDIPHYRVVNAAFTHAHPLGSRFNGPDRGVWYAGLELGTAQAEVAWHKAVQLAEIDCFVESVTYDDYHADFAGAFHDIRGDAAFAACLDPDSYNAAQDLAVRLMAENALGVIYPSVRRAGGSCLACFRPALVGNVRRGARYRFTWEGGPEPIILPEVAG